MDDFDDDECIADDITECDCSRCTAADLAHDHVNGGHGTDDPEHFEDGCPECEAEQKERGADADACDGVHDPGAGALACSVCYPDAFLGFDETDVGRRARRDLELYGMSAVEIDSDGSSRRVAPLFVVTRAPDPWRRGMTDVPRVDRSRWRRTRTALNHLARRARRRWKRERRGFLFRTVPPGTALAGLYAIGVDVSATQLRQMTGVAP